MLCKQITISIPENEEIPEILTSFNSKENYIMIKIGCECIKQARTFLTNLSQEEIYNKIKEESMETIKKLDIDLNIQKEMMKQIKLLEKEKTDYEIQKTVDIYKNNE